MSIVIYVNQLELKRECGMIAIVLSARVRSTARALLTAAALKIQDVRWWRVIYVNQKELKRVCRILIILFGILGKLLDVGGDLVLMEVVSHILIVNPGVIFKEEELKRVCKIY